MILCACGCGQIVKKGNKYINGHNRRNITGWHHSEESKQKQSNTIKINKEIKEGKRLVPEPKYCECGCEQIVKKGNRYIQGHWAKIHNPMKGKYHTEESKKKNSNSHKGKESWCKGLTKENNDSLKRTSEKNSGSNGSNWKGGKIKTVCIYCNEEFEIYPGEKDTRKFCSHNCHNMWKVENHINPKINIKCIICGKNIEIYPREKGIKKFCSNECRGKGLSEARKGIPKSKEWKKKASEARRGKKHPWMIGDKNVAKRPEVREKISISKRGDKNPMNNLKYKERALKNLLKSLKVKPNKKEKELDTILQSILLDDYKYNNGWFILAGKVPDFVNINGQKKLIEFNGCYFHNCLQCYPKGGIDNITNGFEESQERIKYFKQYGYETLIIWEHELEDKKTLINKILKFHDLASHSCTKQLSIDDMENMRRCSKSGP